MRFSSDSPIPQLHFYASCISKCMIYDAELCKAVFTHTSAFPKVLVTYHIWCFVLSDTSNRFFCYYQNQKTFSGMKWSIRTNSPGFDSNIQNVANKGAHHTCSFHKRILETVSFHRKYSSPWSAHLVNPSFVSVKFALFYKHYTLTFKWSIWRRKCSIVIS